MTPLPDFLYSPEYSVGEKNTNPIIPHWYYEELLKIGKENICNGKFVEGLGYILPDVEIICTRDSEGTFYDFKINNNIIVKTKTASLMLFEGNVRSSLSNINLTQNNNSTVTKPDTIPFFIKESRYPQIYNHHKDAITLLNKPTYLTYDSDKKNAEIRRKQSLQPWERKSLLDRDEYPYATTFEGGYGASISYVEPSQNRRHGADIRWLRLGFNMKTGDVFKIILIPDEKEKNPKMDPVLHRVLLQRR